MNTKKILISGEAGVGKTTFCTKFCQDWALIVKEIEGKGQELEKEQKSELEKLTEEQRSKLNNIGLLLYIVLRDIDEGAKNVKDIIISQLGKEGTYIKQGDLKSQLLNLLNNVSEQRKLVLLMDGFDEILDQYDIIEDVITGQSYQNIYWITTCRPHATCGIVLEVDLEIRLKGFSEAQAKSFVEMYAGTKCTIQDQRVLYVKKIMSQIKSSEDLCEMSTNPSMLQLLCLLIWKNGKIGKDRTSVFKDYTSYLLMQFHKKQRKKEDFYSEKTLYDSYHQNLLDAGKVALMGLRQNQLNLVFSKSEALQIGGDEIFDIGFLTELPSTDTDSVKVQFTHKTLQEYLAAFYVVNTPANKGLQLLLEFCSTSKRLMGSQMILEFVSNMSTQLEGEIQKQITYYVSSWDSDDKVDPERRSSFLISMLEGNETLQFPLPAEVDIDLRKYDLMSDQGKKSALGRFLNMDGHGVRKINLTLGKYRRLNVLQNTTINSLDELTVNGCKLWSGKDSKNLCEVITKVKPGLLSITNVQDVFSDKDEILAILQYVHTLILDQCEIKKEQLLSTLRTINESCIKIDCNNLEAVSKLSSDRKSDKEIPLIHEDASMKSLSIRNCGTQIDTEIAEAVTRMPDHMKLDLSGNQVTDKSACITLIHKTATMKSLSLCNCGIQIDIEIAEAVSRLPDHAQLDLSGNQVTDKLACITLIHKAATMKSLVIPRRMSNIGIVIDPEIAKAVSKLPIHAQLDLSGNLVTDKSACITLIHKSASMKSLSICNCGIQIDTDIAEAVPNLPDHTELDLSGNRVTDKSACISLIRKAAMMKSLNIHDCMSNCRIQIDIELAEAVSRLPDHTQLDLSGNRITDKSACITLINKAAIMKSLKIHDCMSNCGMQIDTDIAEAVSNLPDQTELDLSGNRITDKSACISLIRKAAMMKSLNIQDCMSNCRIQIDIEIAEAVSRLPDHTELDLSGNQVTDKSACITLIHKAANMKSLNIHNCMSKRGMQIDTEIAEAVSNLPDHTQLDLSGNQVTDKSACITLINKAATLKCLNIHDCMSNCGIQIDAKMAEAISRLPDHTELDLSGNRVTDNFAFTTLIHNAITMKSLNIHNCMSNCGIQIDTEIAFAVSRLPDHTQLDLSGNKVTDKSACITLIHKAATMKSLNIHNCMSNSGIDIDAETAEAISRLPDNTQLDLSGNQVTDKSACIALIHKAARMKSLSLCNCGTIIDTEIAEAVSRLPDHSQLDLSGNKVTDKSVCITLIHKAATMKSLILPKCMSKLGILIDTKLAEAVSRLPDHTQLDLSDNKIKDTSACIALIRKATTMKSISLSNCGTQIDTEIAEAVSKLPDHTELDLSGNQVTDKSVCITLINKAATMKSLDIHNCMSNCGIKIDTKIAKAVCRLPDDIQLDLSGNRITKMDPRLLPGVLLHMPEDNEIDMTRWGITIDVNIVKALSKMPQLKSLKASCNKVTPEAAKEIFISQLQKLDLSNCGIHIDKEIAEAVSKLPDHTELDLSGNKVTDTYVCITLIHKAATIKSLIIPKCMCNFGIPIDKKIAKSVSRLPDHTDLDLSGNKVTGKSACITLIHKAATMKSLNIHDCMSNCDIEIDTEIAEAVSRLPDYIQLDLSGNKLTKMDIRLLPGILLHMPEDNEIDMTGWGIKIDLDIVKALSKMPKLKSLKASYNKLTSEAAKELFLSKLQKFDLSNCGIHIDTEIAVAVSLLPDHTQLDLSGNRVTDKSACIRLIHKAATMKSLSICNCLIHIDTEIAEAISMLPGHTQLDLSGNCVIDKYACIKLIDKAARMKYLSICNCLIRIDTEIAEAISRLPGHAQLDLSGNVVIDKYQCILLIHSCSRLKSLSICNCRIQIDRDIAKAVSWLRGQIQLDLSGNTFTDKSACIMLINTAATMKSLSICNCMSNCGIEIDTDIAFAVFRLPDQTQLDLSGNQVTEKSACITLIHKAERMKSLNIHDCMSNCRIQIDIEIAVAVSRLPDHTQLDLSGNKVTDKSACITLIHKAATMKSLNIHNCMSNCRIQIDTEVAEAVSRLPDHTELDLSGNLVTKSASITLIRKAATIKSLNISRCDIWIDTKAAEAVSRLPDDIQLDLSGNNVLDKFACIPLINKAATMKSLSICNCGIWIDREIAEAVSRLPDHTELDLSGNEFTYKSACITLIHKAATMKSLSLCKCGIKIDTEIAKAVCRLPDDIQLGLSGNRITKIDPRLLPGVLLHMPEDNEIDMTRWGIKIDLDIVKALSKMPQLKSLKASCNKVTPEAAKEIFISQLQKLDLSNCGIHIDKEIAEAVSKIPHHAELDLSGNKVTDKSACITLIHKAATMKSLIICNCGIQIDKEIAEAVSKIPHHAELDLSGNKVTDKSACITLIHKPATMKSLKIQNCMSNCGIKI